MVRHYVVRRSQAGCHVSKGSRGQGGASPDCPLSRSTVIWLEHFLHNKMRHTKRQEVFGANAKKGKKETRPAEQCRVCASRAGHVNRIISWEQSNWLRRTCRCYAAATFLFLLLFRPFLRLMSHAAPTRKCETPTFETRLPVDRRVPSSSRQPNYNGAVSLESFQ